MPRPDSPCYRGNSGSGQPPQFAQANKSEEGLPKRAILQKRQRSCRLIYSSKIREPPSQVGRVLMGRRPRSVDDGFTSLERKKIGALPELNGDLSQVRA